MKSRQFILYYVLFVVVLFGWQQFLTIFYPTKSPEQREAEFRAREERAKIEKEAATEAKAPDDPAIAEKDPEGETKPDAPAPPPVKIEEVQIHLGSRDPQSPFLLEAVLTNQGAAVQSITFSRYEDESRSQRLTLFGNDPTQRPSYLLGIEGQTLDQKNWEVVSAGKDHVTFRTVTEDGRLQIEKRYRLPEDSYFMDLDVVVLNRSESTVRDETYWLQSGNGLEIEGKWYTRYYRQFVVAMRPKEGDAFLQEQPVSSVADGSVRPYVSTPIQFTGVVNQYFASLLVQKPDARDERLIASAEPLVYERDRRDIHFTNFTATAKATPFTLEPGQEVVHAYHLFNGPKAEKVLDTQVAEELPLLIYYPPIFGMPTGWIARPMIALLRKLYSFVHDYGIAIILLTVVVRSCMFPLSYTATLKTQAMTKKMQVIQPLVNELKVKYENDKEKLNRALMDLYAKHQLNPLGGCLFPFLLIFLQIPIFGGLYQALSLCLDLRQAPFLWGYTWIDDLSAPDRLFGFPWNLPFLGPYFNLLPILAALQMSIQMKLTMPPATTPELEMNQKMMKIMPWMMAFMFYNVPSGLCVYFITSGLWTMIERQLLPKSLLNTAPANATGTPVAATPAGSATPGGTGDASWKKPVDKKKRRS